jgi:hypothetical protein
MAEQRDEAAPASTERIDEAKRALARNWPLIALSGKVPVHRGWQKREPDDQTTICLWIKQGRNLGLRTGRASGVIVLDDDSPDGSASAALNLPKTVTVVTGTGKRHFYFLAPGDFLVKNSAKTLAPGIDVRGDGGQVVFVGSIHPDTKKPYAWAPGLSPDDVPIAPLPAHLLERLRPEAHRTKPKVVNKAKPTTAGSTPDRAPAGTHVQAAFDREVNNVLASVEGNRNDTLNKSAFALGQLVGAGALDREKVRAALHSAATKVGLPETEAASTIDSGLAAGSKKPLNVVSTWDSDRRLSVVVSYGLARFADRVDPRSSRSRKHFLNALEQAIPRLVTDDLEGVDNSLIAMAAEGPPAAADLERTDAAVLAERDATSQAKLDSMPAEIRADANALLADPLLTDRVVDHAAALGIAGERSLALAVYLVGTSRLLAKPLSACVQGSSSSGKSFVIDKVASLFPDEAVLRATDMTQNALYYLAHGDLMHRFVCAGERTRHEDDASADRTRALREVISSGELRKVLPEKVHDHITTKVIRSPGPIAYVESTTVTEFFAEDANRLLLLGTDDSDVQTRRILANAAARAAGTVSVMDSQRLIEVHHALQRMLRRLQVRVPFAERVLSAMPSEKPEARRAAGLVLGMVQAVALLHQRQRGGDGLAHGDTIDATLEDYAIARRLLIGPIGRMLGGGLPAHTQAFGEWLLSMGIPSGSEHGAVFKAPTELLKRPGCRWKRAQVAEHIRRLVTAGTLDRTGHGSYKVVGPLPEAGAAWLPILDREAGELAELLS